MEPMYSGGYGTSPKKQPAPTAPSVLQKMNSIAPGPFELNRRGGSRNAFAPKNDRNLTPESNMDDYSMERPGTAASYSSNKSGGGVAPPRVPRKNGYGGFGPPQRDGDEEFEPKPFGLNQRSETFPKQRQNAFNDAPSRTPSAPGPRPDRTRRPTNEFMEQPDMSRGRQRRPSIGVRDTSRPPPPRNSSIRPTTAGRDGSIPINLADEFGAGNPYHSPSVSQSSSKSGYSQMSQPSQPSSNTSPARSTSSRRGPSNTTNFDALMDDLQSSMQTMDPPSQGLDKSFSQKYNSRRQAPEDLRFDPAIQGGREQRLEAPLASPALGGSFSNRNDPAIQGNRSRSPAVARRNRQPSIGRSRGNCKSCMLPITGKSVASADGQLTGRYHKACFVCTTCSEPFSSSTFYVLGDKPYCEQHYHKLNGSLCGHCDIGIEGQYLEDETTQKYHTGCFRCGDCDQVLRDGYFEVNGKAYCERDAWKRVQQPAMNVPPGIGGLRPTRNGRPFGLPSGNRLGAPGTRLRMERRMTRLGIM